jgi:ferritin-like metal-binding protein YciE
LVKKLPKLKLQVTFKDLKHAIEETIENGERQIARMDLICMLFNTGPSDESCNGLKGLVDDAFIAIEQ